MGMGCSFPELDVFIVVKDYLIGQDWEDVIINRVILDNGDVEFIVFLKSGEQTFMKTLSRTDFEELILAAYAKDWIVNIIVNEWADTIDYSFSSKIEILAR